MKQYIFLKILLYLLNKDGYSNIGQRYSSDRNVYLVEVI